MTFRTAEFRYFDGESPRIFAHRGLHTNHPENSAGAFRAALDAGFDRIETDVVASCDGVAMIAHDLTLDRVAGVHGRVRDFSAAELEDTDIGGEGFLTLDRALTEFPLARFNIDIKDSRAIPSTVETLLSHGATDRVLITSFSARRRRQALAALVVSVASSASASEAFAIALGARAGRIRVPASVHALQVPVQSAGFSVITEPLVERYHGVGLEVHAWTINDPAEARRLVALGVDGIVSDRPDLIRSALDS